MGTTKAYQDYSELAWVAYGKGFIAGSYIDKDKNNILTDPKNEVKFTSTQATAFANRYTVLATSAQYGIGTANSFDAVLFGERDSQGHIINKILAVRGTQGPIDIIVDIAELGGTGTVVSQTTSMESFYRALISDKKLTATEHINVTGHSLGGFLTQVFTAKHSSIVDHAYTYNAPGVGGLKVEVYQQLGIIPANIDTSKITNVIASDSLTLIAGFGIMAGEIVEIPGGSHSIVDVTNTLTQMNTSGTNGHVLTYSSLNASQKSTLDTLSNWITTKLNQAGNLADGILHSLENTVETIHDALFNPSAQVSAKIVDGNLSFSDGKQTIVSSISNHDTYATHTLDTYSPIGTKTSSTISAYNTTGDLIGRTTSSQPAEYFAVPITASPSSVLETLHQKQDKNETLAQDAFAIAKFVGLDNPTKSDWLKTLVPATNTPSNTTLPSVPYDFYRNQNQVPDYGFTTGNNGGVSDYPNNGGGGTIYVYPVILDLDGDGVELTSLKDSHAWFDTIGDGILHKTGWVGADDGLLVIDENGDGKITAREMAFASRTAANDTDLQALASEFDSNHDGKLDNKDTQFSKFRVWKDTNGNAETDAGELMTLAVAKVVSVGLNSTAVSLDIEGNKIAGFATYIKTDGTTGSVGDVSFAYDPLGYTVTQKTGYTQLSQTDGLSYAIATGAALNLSLVTAAVDGAIGGIGNDTLNATGKTTDVVLEGGEGNDVLTGGSGNDWLKGGTGNDILNGGDGNDTIVMDSADTVANVNGGAGFDTLLVEGTGAVAMDLNARGFESAVGSDGSDTFTTSGNGRVVLLGKAGNDTLSGGGNGDLLEGGSGNDTLNGGAGIDTLQGGTGNDTYIVDNVGDIVTENLNEGTDSVQSNITYTLETNLENLTLTEISAINGVGNSLSNVIVGNSGNNILDGGAGIDTLQGGMGNDTYIVDTTTDLITENVSAGTDTVQSSISYTLGANLENLTLTEISAINGVGNSLNNVIVGNSGNNILDGGMGADTLKGGAGNDTYIVDNTGDIVTENLNEGTDSVQSNISYALGANVENLTLVGTDVINATGNELNNIIVGNSKNNVLNGGKGNDTYSFGQGSGADTINDSFKPGGKFSIPENAGNDTIKIGSGITLNDLELERSGSDLIMAIRGGANTSTAITSLADRLTIKEFSNINSAVENISFSDGTTLALNSWKIGTAGSDTLTDGIGNGRLYGGRGDDTLDGGSGNDIMSGGTGADTMKGGGGDDLYIVDSTGDGIIENINEGIDTVKASISYTLGTNVENLTLSGMDNINGTGNGLNNVINANTANNVLNGAAGNDTMFGGGGNDTYIFNKGSGSDNIFDNSTAQVKVRTGWFSSGYRTFQTYAGNDTVQFGAGISTKDIAFYMNGSSLFMNYGDNDTLSVSNQSVANNAIEKFTLADGNFLTSNDLNVIIQSMNAYATAHDIAITSIDSVKANQDLMNIVAGAWHQ